MDTNNPLAPFSVENPPVLPGDFVVPSSNAHGTALEPGKTIGDASALAAKIAKHAASVGECTAPFAVNPAPAPSEKPARGRKKKESIVAPRPPLVFTTNPVIAKPIEVVFKNQFGKISVGVEKVLESELGYCLVFATKTEMRFIPNPAEVLEVGIDGGPLISVMFPNITFQWVDGVRQLMILIKNAI